MNKEHNAFQDSEVEEILGSLNMSLANGNCEEHSYIERLFLVSIFLLFILFVFIGILCKDCILIVLKRVCGLGTWQRPMASQSTDLKDSDIK